jgi:hypothetical protein
VIAGAGARQQSAAPLHRRSAARFQIGKKLPPVLRPKRQEMRIRALSIFSTTTFDPS